MPNPTASDVHVNAPLTNISIAFMQSADEFVADRVFPNVPVTKQSDRYFVYDRGDFYRNEVRERAPGTESAGGGWKIDNTPTYFATVYALHKDIDDQIRANADDPLNMDRDAALYLAQQALQKRDITWASKYFKTGVWTGASDFTPGTLWSAGSSTPIKDIRTKIKDVKKKTGFRANKLVLAQDVWDILADHADLLDRIKYTQTGIVAPQLLASVLQLDEVLVWGAVKTTSNELASDTYDFLGTKDALLVYAAPTPSIMQPSAGYTFSWTGLLGAGAQGQRIKTFRVDEVSSDRVEIEMAYDQKVVSADLGVFFDNVIA